MVSSSSSRNVDSTDSDSSNFQSDRLHESISLLAIADDANDYSKQRIKDVISGFHTAANGYEKRTLIDRALYEHRDIFSSTSKDGPATPVEILRRCLSTRSLMSTASSFAEHMQKLAAATATANPTKLRVIGVGTFGVVFELPGTTLAIKKPLHGPSQAAKLIDEFDFGRKIHQAIYFKATGVFKNDPTLKDLAIPRVPGYMYCFGAIKSDGQHDWWQRNGSEFPQEQGYGKPGPVFYFEKIMPLPREIRTSLIRHFFPPASVDSALLNDLNNDALIRPYLGHSWSDLSPSQREIGRSSLRNFPLYIDELEFLEMDPELIAKDMALAVAAAHWSAGIDLLDSEFVIGSRPTYSKYLEAFMDASLYTVDKTTSFNRPPEDIVPSGNTFQSLHTHNRAVQLWLVDFDKCAEFHLEFDTAKADIEDLVRRTRSNDPYYPSSIPASNLEARAWQGFRDTYITASRILLKAKLQEYDGVSRTLGRPAVTAEEEWMLLDRPKQVMKEWYHQERSAMDPTEFERRKAIAIKDGRYGNSSDGKK